MKSIGNVLFPIFLLLVFTPDLHTQERDSLSLALDDTVHMQFIWLKTLGIWSGQYEVTNRQYQKFMRYRDGSQIQGASLSESLQPAVFVSYCDAQGFCFWLNTNTDIPNGFEARLPTKEEWDYFINPGNKKLTLPDSVGSNLVGNFLDETAHQTLGWDWHLKGYVDGFPVSAPVDQSSRNELNLFGVKDNVREWTNEKGESGNWYIIRGASWRDSDPKVLRWDYGVAGAIWGKDNHIGFRVVIAPKLD